MIERYHLAILREVDRQGSLTAAAKKLHLTQPALSHAIRKFEEQANIKLWVKEGRQLRLTQAGEHLLGLAKRLLPQLEHSDDILRQFARGERGTLRIGMECHPCYRWLMKQVGQFLRDWPGVELDIKQQFRFGGMAALFNNDIDLLITPDPLQRAGVTFTPVLDYEQILVVADNHPLATKTQVTPKDLAEQVLITYPVEIERLDIFNDFLLPAQQMPKRHKTIESTDIIIEMVAAGRGVAAFPDWLVAELQERFAIKPLRLGDKGIDKQLYIGIRDGDSKVGYIRTFLGQAE